MTQTFNKVRYIELLKKDRGLESKNSSLYKEDRMEHRELLSYEVILYNQIIYNRRHDYISLIEKYVTNEIDSLLLRLQFFQIQREDRKIKKDIEKNFERLYTVLIDSKSGEFSLLIADTFDACEALKSDSEPEEAYGITELQLEVRFKFIQVFSSVNIEKVFFIQEFLSSYSSVISNQRKKNIKKYFIQLVHLFKEHDLIEDSYKIISNGHYYFTKEFNTHDISEGFVIYEKLSI